LDPELPNFRHKQILHANLEIRVILAILENRKSLFPWIFGFPDHPHTVEVAGSNPAPPIALTELFAVLLHAFCTVPSVDRFAPGTYDADMAPLR
jgi:hypothetical protein